MGAREAIYVQPPFSLSFLTVLFASFPWGEGLFPLVTLPPFSLSSLSVLLASFPKAFFTQKKRVTFGQFVRYIHCPRLFFGWTAGRAAG